MEQRWSTGGAVGAIGLPLAAIQVVHAIQRTAIPVAVAVDAVPFVAMGLGVTFAGFWIARRRAVDGRWAGSRCGPSAA